MAPPGPPPGKDMARVPGGTFLMGSNDFYPEERPAHRVADYLATRRDEAEGHAYRQPDHWAAYGLAALAPAGLTDVEAEYGRWLAGYFGFFVRFESQHTGRGLVSFEESGAGLGTTGTLMGVSQYLREQSRTVIAE